MRFKRRSRLPLYNYTGKMRSLVIREITILQACLQVGSYEGFLDSQVGRKESYVFYRGLQCLFSPVFLIKKILVTYCI